jgi:hypothetical protein
MNPSSFPVSLDAYAKRSYVMKGSENSMPEKNKMKVKWVALSSVCEFVRTRGFTSVLAWPLPFEVVFSVPLLAGAADGSVSGRQK